MHTYSPLVIVIALGVSACGGANQPATDSTRTNAHATASAPPLAPPPPADVVVRGAAVIKDNHAIIQAEAVGPIRVGMWRRQAMSLVYAVTAAQGAPGEDMIVVRGIGRDTLTLAVVNDTVRRVLVTRPGPHTEDGLAVGTALARVAGMPGAHVEGSGATQRVTIAKYCGIEFSGAPDATDVKLHVAPLKNATGAPIVRTIIVGACTSGARAP